MDEEKDKEKDEQEDVERETETKGCTLAGLVEGAPPEGSLACWAGVAILGKDAQVLDTAILGHWTLHCIGCLNVRTVKQDTLYDISHASLQQYI